MTTERDVGPVGQIVHLRSESISVVLRSDRGGMPGLVYWGRALDQPDLDDLAAIDGRAVARASLDEETMLGLVTESGAGFPGMPGIEGHRPGGAGHAPRFGATAPVRRDTATEQACGWTLADPVAGLTLELSIALCTRSEVLRLSLSLTNDGDTPYAVDRLAPSVELPSWATELSTFSGRWTLEFQPQRHRWEPGAWVAENRRGRTSHDRIPALFAGTAGFDETSGDVWGLTLGWSGNSRVVAERLSDGRRHLQLGELLLSGEVVLEPGESMTAPTVHGAYSPAGLASVSHAFHRFIRGRDHHPGSDRPRPVMLNTWEAVYFHHDVRRLSELANRAAEVGVERFVVDDGWFLGRNDDTSALGDWVVDPVKYPDGLGPLVDRVRSLGMDFGLWFEPEMVNPDSELFRAHPDWALEDERYPRHLGRNQLVLDLVNPEAWQYVFDQVDRLLTEYDIAYIKWDMNRDLVQATHAEQAGVRRQTLAVYRLIDELRRRHPGVEIESCSSGGARADFEILARTERIWTSDSNDALDRQKIQRGFSMLFPPEVMGAHIGPPTSHTTGRRHDLGLRSASAFLGHLGIEWNLLAASAAKRKEIAAFVELYKQHRQLLHSGDWRRLDSADPSVSIMGVVASDRSEAVFVYARVASNLDAVHGPIRFAGLDEGRRYRVTNLTLPGPNRDRGIAPPPWLYEPEVVVSGRVLMEHGLPTPVMDPESALLLHLAADRESDRESHS